jgi:hypothetical protein
VLKGAAVGTPSGFVAGGLLGLLCGPGAIICTPVGALGGGLIGLVGGGTYGGISGGNRAVPEETAKQLQNALLEAIADRDLQAELRNNVLSGSGTFRMIDLGAQAGNGVEASSGAVSILEISLTQLTFSGEGGENPTLSLVIAARAKLTRPGGKQVLWSAEEISYSSGGAASSLWASRNSDLLKAEIARGIQSIARKIDDALFRTADVPDGAV